MNHVGLIRVPEHTAEKIRKIQSAAAQLRQELGTEPTVGEIAERLDMQPDKVEQLLSLAPEVCSLDTPVGTEEDSTLGTLIPDDQMLQPQEELVRQELDRAIDSLLGALDARQQQILRLRYGMEDGICHSLEDIGKRLGISKERVRQIESQAMDKLQKLGLSMGLEDFLS